MIPLDPLVELKDVTIKAHVIDAFGKGTLPKTMQTDEMYTLSIWMRNHEQPIVITYLTRVERDEELEIIMRAMYRDE